jgi:aminopeptidase N
MLRGLLGEEVMRRAFTTFLSRNCYLKAGTEEFRAALEDASGRDLRPYFEAWVRGTSVAELRLASETERAGDAFTTTVRVTPSGLPGPVPLLLSVAYAGGRTERRVTLEPGGGVFTIETPARVQKVEANADRALLVRVKGS